MCQGGYYVPAYGNGVKLQGLGAGVHQGLVEAGQGNFPDIRVPENLGLALQREKARAILCRFLLQKEAQKRVAARSFLCSENTHREEVDGDLMEL